MFINFVARSLAAASLLISIGATVSAENRFLKYVGGWKLFITRNNSCAIGATARAGRIVIRVYHFCSGAGTVSPEDSLVPMQIDINDNKITPKPSAAGKAASMSIGEESFAGGIVKVASGKMTLLFTPRSKVFAELSKTGELRFRSDFFAFDLPFDPLHDQINAFTDCEQALKKLTH